MSTLLIYVHLAVIFLVGAFFIAADRKWAKTLGVLNSVFALVCAYIYAIYSLWVMCR